jgi:tripartite-type tricarboxylate transporter receptor subunit TctC
MRKRDFLGALATVPLALSAQSALAQAQTWPSKPVTIVVPFAPGGSTDATARMIAAKLRAVFNQSFLIDNRPGAGGNIGADFVAKAAPDGHTLLLATSSHVTNISLYKSLPYDLVRDLAPISQVAVIPSLLVVNPSVTAKTLPDFIKLAQDSRAVSYGSSGSGSSPHLAAEVFNKMAGTRMVHVPYKGSGPALIDLLGGQIQAVFAPFIDALPHVRAGKLRALGMTSKTRSTLLPEVPAIAEVLTGYDVVLWNGIFAPTRTQPEILQRLSQAINEVLRQEETKKLLAEQGSEPSGSSPEAFRQYVASEIPKWKGLVEVSGAKVE